MPGGKQIRPLDANLIWREALPLTEIHVDKRGEHFDFQSGRFRDGLCRAHGPRERARIEGCRLPPGGDTQPGVQRLADSGFVQRNVKPASKSLLHVPIRLPVTYEKKSGHLV